ncbi:hypothetical protein BJ912DRAFT_945873 [Pholiota molesta]|nr:hypothetical protein BJ912DRAFT_945873 [Pholiota molesta]
MFLCIPIVFGCPSKIKPEGQEAPRLCPQCHNLSVIRAKRTMWFELFWLPLVPIHWKHIWICTICQWNQEVQKNAPDQGLEATAAQGAVQPSFGATPQAQVAPRRPGYQPAYIGQEPPTKA